MIYKGQDHLSGVFLFFYFIFISLYISNYFPQTITMMHRPFMRVWSLCAWALTHSRQVMSFGMGELCHHWFSWIKCLITSLVPRYYWFIISWIYRNKLQWNLYRNTKLFCHENIFEIAICKIATILFKPLCVNSLWPGDTIWWQRSDICSGNHSGSLTAPSHYLNQCWLIMKDILWYSSKSYITRGAYELNL